MTQKKIISIIVVAAIAVASVAAAVFLTGSDTGQKEFQTMWIRSGPFAVMNYEHKLGDTVFLSVSDLAPHEKGTIRVFTPKNFEYTSIPFDGSTKSDFNSYFIPTTSVRENTCSPQDFVGVWTVEFEGVQYTPIQFEFMDEYIADGDRWVRDLCR